MSNTLVCHTCHAAPGMPCINVRTSHVTKYEHVSRGGTFQGAALAKSPESKVTITRVSPVTNTVVMAPAVPGWWTHPVPTWKYVNMADSYVWCDEHCEVHKAEPDVYKEGNDACMMLQWRPVYVGTDDFAEDF